MKSSRPRRSKLTEVDAALNAAEIQIPNSAEQVISGMKTTQETLSPPNFGGNIKVVNAALKEANGALPTAQKLDADVRNLVEAGKAAAAFARDLETAESIAKLAFKWARVGDGEERAGLCAEIKARVAADMPLMAIAAASSPSLSRSATATEGCNTAAIDNAVPHAKTCTAAIRNVHELLAKTRYSKKGKRSVVTNLFNEVKSKLPAADALDSIMIDLTDAVRDAATCARQKQMAVKASVLVFDCAAATEAPSDMMRQDLVDLLVKLRIVHRAATGGGGGGGGEQLKAALAERDQARRELDAVRAELDDLRKNAFRIVLEDPRSNESDDSDDE